MGREPDVECNLVKAVGGYEIRTLEVPKRRTGGFTRFFTVFTCAAGERDGPNIEKALDNLRRQGWEPGR